VGTANRQLHRNLIHHPVKLRRSINRTLSQRPRSNADTVRDSRKVSYFTQDVAPHQENYATIYNYLKRELRYRDAGERGSQALAAEPVGTPGYQ
jgi:hypothetical protein